MRITRSDLRKMLKPMVREFVEEAVEELITESYIQKTIQESVLRGDTISHVIAEVVRGYTSVPQIETQRRPQRNAPQVQQITETYDVDSDPILNQIKELSNNSELSKILNQRRHSTDAVDAQYAQPDAPAQTTEKGQINWGSLASSIPPDSDHVGLQPGGRMSLKEASAHINPLGSVQGEGVPLGVLSALSEKSIWDKEKLNKFMNMGNQQVETIRKTHI